MTFDMLVSNISNDARKTLYDKILNFFFFSVCLGENSRKRWNLDHIAVAKIISKCFRPNGYDKWRNSCNLEKFVVLAQYLKHQTDCSRHKRKINKAKRFFCDRICCIYLYLSNKSMPCHGAIYGLQLRSATKLRKTQEKYFLFHWNCEMYFSNCEINFPLFSETIHTALKMLFQHVIR